MAKLCNNELIITYYCIGCVYYYSIIAHYYHYYHYYVFETGQLADDGIMHIIRSRFIVVDLSFNFLEPSEKKITKVLVCDFVALNS